MRIVQHVDDLRAAIADARGGGRAVAFVPTMGALHDGHASLVRAARETGAFVVVSCFVNPRQFGPGEDLDRYPRTPDSDEDVAREAGCELLWRPTVEDVYGAEDELGTRILAGPLGDGFEGAGRPGHFDGVVQVVARLLGAVQPDLLLLGEKDYQQLVVLRRLVADLLLPVEVRGIATARDTDGLALSSRNAYLSPDERAAALAIPRALDAAAAAAAAGGDTATVRGAALEVLASQPALRVAYVELVDSHALRPLSGALAWPARLLVAAHVGTTRLIDNVAIHPPRKQQP